jgi:transcription elongation factor Elf1
MESFLICQNPKCRFLVDLRENGAVLPRSKLILRECPECGHLWSSHCPFCHRSLRIAWRKKLAHCSHCGKPMRSEAA